LQGRPYWRGLRRPGRPARARTRAGAVLESGDDREHEGPVVDKDAGSGLDRIGEVQESCRYRRRVADDVAGRDRKLLAFNQDYNAPKFKAGKPVEFVKHLAQIALGKNPNGPAVDMFCSEFVWSLQSLRDCDPAKTAGDFDGSGIPACVKQPMKPMLATGEYAFKRNNRSNAGLADGPLMVIDALKPPAEERKKLLASVFVQNPGRMTKLSAGHKSVAEQMQPKFEPLSRYYAGAGGGFFENAKARLISKAFIREIPENYSPTSYLINTLLPRDSTYRSMDYVATVVIE